MTRLMLALCLVLAGCSTTVPVKQKFPDVPPALMEPCAPLREVDADKGTLRDLLRTVIANYAAYYQCAARASTWQEWYNLQRQIFNDANNK